MLPENLTSLKCRDFRQNAAWVCNNCKCRVNVVFL